MARHFPGLKCSIVPLQNDAYKANDKRNSFTEKRFFTPASGALLSSQSAGSKRVRLCVVGAIGREKGYDVLHHAALDAAQKDLPLEFVIVGHTPNDQLLFNTGRIFITEPYQEKDAVSLIRSFKSDAAFFPSIWPETWCLTLGLAWQAGLPAFVFDHGAPAERVRHTGRGWLLNSKLPVSALNQVLINTVLGCKNSNDTKNHNPLVNL